MPKVHTRKKWKKKSYQVKGGETPYAITLTNSNKALFSKKQVERDIVSYYKQFKEQMILQDDLED
jgi:DNA primase